MQDYKFVVEIENAITKEKGYLLEIDGALMVSPELNTECAMFNSRFVAARFIKDRSHLLKGSTKIVPIEEAKGLVKVDKNTSSQFCFILVYKKVDGKNIGGFIHYDPATKQYLNKPKQKGACVWKNEADAEAFIKAIKDKEDDQKGIVYTVLPLKEGKGGNA